MNMQRAEKQEVVVAHSDPDTRSMLVETVSELGYSIRRVCQSTHELLEACCPDTPDLILTGIQLEEDAVVETLIEISEEHPTPAIVVTPKKSLLDVEAALSDHIMAYLVEPVDRDQIKPMIFLVCERFRQFQYLKEENEDLRQALVDRKLIERAKGILMAEHEWTEDEAFRALQNQARSRRLKLAKLAAEVVEKQQAESE